MNNITTLYDWQITTPHEHAPPEYGFCISGRTLGHQKYADGTRITTSRVAHINGNTVETVSGSHYKLQDAAPDYVEWCKKQDCHIPTNDEPIKVIHDANI